MLLKPTYISIWLEWCVLLASCLSSHETIVDTDHCFWVLLLDMWSALCRLATLGWLSSCCKMGPNGTGLTRMAERPSITAYCMSILSLPSSS